MIIPRSLKDKVDDFNNLTRNLVDKRIAAGVERPESVLHMKREHIFTVCYQLPAVVCPC